jgi:hypothetical protein
MDKKGFLLGVGMIARLLMIKSLVGSSWFKVIDQLYKVSNHELTKTQMETGKMLL